MVRSFDKDFPGLELMFEDFGVSVEWFRVSGLLGWFGLQIRRMRLVCNKVMSFGNSDSDNLNPRAAAEAVTFSSDRWTVTCNEDNSLYSNPLNRGTMQ